jgi:putative inorganic carbon (HCO3(-)) transporter
MIQEISRQYPRGLLWGILLFFVVVIAAALMWETYYILVAPLVLLVTVLAFLALDKYLLLMVFFVPLSIPLSGLIEDLSVDLYLPTEPLLAGLLLLFILKYLAGQKVDLAILRHPVTLAIYFQLAWIFITSLTSTDPLVSIKFLASRIWFVVGFYFVASQLFRKEENMRRYIWIFLLAFTGVAIYTVLSLSQYGLDNQMKAHEACHPFYKDHTSYGATIGFVLPLLVPLFLFIRKENVNYRILMVLLIGFLLLATIVSYTRATWVSILGAVGLWAVIKLRIRFEYVFAAAAIMIYFFISIWPRLMIQMEQNQVESSGELSEHVQSISNISTDASNRERINRWSCAIRMWQDKPIFGFGPGTYQFEYGRYQRSFEKTDISTNFGTRGNAHSEYLGPLSESGVFGLISILLVIGTTIYTGIRVFYTARKKEIRILALALLVGLFSYYLHGFLNNFLDTDKISVLFWGYTAMLVAMDVYHRDTLEESSGEKAAPATEKDT